jgi:hypothetical protein
LDKLQLPKSPAPDCRLQDRDHRLVAIGVIEIGVMEKLALNLCYIVTFLSRPLVLYDGQHIIVAMKNKYVKEKALTVKKSCILRP